MHCSALVSAFEKAKKKYVVKVKKMETQMELMTERHESQVVFFYLCHIPSLTVLLIIQFRSVSLESYAI